MDKPILDYAYGLIDNEEINAPLLFFSQIYQNDKMGIYRHDQFCSVFEWMGYNFPSSVYKYKDKYICIISSNHPRISEKEFNKRFPEFILEHECDEEFCESINFQLGKIVFPKDSLPFLLNPRGEGDSREFYEYSEVWPYLPGYKKNEYLNIMQTEIFLDNGSKPLKKEELKAAYLTEISIGINFTTLSDSILYVPLEKNKGGYFALLNGRDTLILSPERHSSWVKDGLLTLYPESSRSVYFTFADSLFYKKLTPLNDQTLLYKLVTDSLFYFPTSNRNDDSIPALFFASEPIKPMSVGYKTMYLNNMIYEEGKFVGFEE